MDRELVSGYEGIESSPEAATCDGLSLSRGERAPTSHMQPSKTPQMKDLWTTGKGLRTMLDADDVDG